MNEINADLESFTLIMHHDCGLRVFQFAIEADSLLWTPFASQVGVKYDLALCTTEGDQEQGIVSILEGHLGVVDGVCLNLVQVH